MTNLRLRIPPTAILWLCAVCFVPALLLVTGANFDARLPETGSESVVEMYHSMAGAFMHTILEWSSVVVAMVIMGFSFVHYRIHKNIVLPIIGMAIGAAGAMDAFHTLVAARLINGAADQTNFVPFTWAVARTFHPIAIVASAIVVLRLKSIPKSGAMHLNFIALVFCIAGYAVIRVTASIDQLPNTMNADGIFARPFDIPPIILYGLAGLFVYPRLIKKYPSMFSRALMVSLIPEISTELYMLFGSRALFDGAFNVAHLLKTVSYLVPLGGLMIDYRDTHRRLVKSNGELQGRAARDSLTGLWNKAVLEKNLDKIFEDGGKAGALIMIDLDHFKQVNDSHGHEVGSAVIRTVAIALQSSVRQSDIVCRYGGEEFTILLLGAGKAYAMELSERMRAKIEETSFREAKGLRVTASFGVCTIAEQDHRNAGEVIARADANMYRAKSGGRNRVEG